MRTKINNMLAVAFMFCTSFIPVEANGSITNECNRKHEIVKVSGRFDTRTKSNRSAEEINKVLDGKLSNMGNVFKDAEEKYNVNSLFLASIAIHESGNGKSKLITKRNNACGIKLNKRYGEFAKVEDSIYFMAKCISNGKYYHTKKRYTISQISKIYAPLNDSYRNRYWEKSIISLMNLFK